jgi:hypothetical protein
MINRAVAGMIVALLAMITFSSPAASHGGVKPPPTPTFYKDVAPIVQKHCQSCHRPGQIGPMSLVTYDDVRKRASLVEQMVQHRKMPPWFADPPYGPFANDPSLTESEIETIGEWVQAGAPAGNPADAPPAKKWVEGWSIQRPDSVIRMPEVVHIPPTGDVDYTYEIVPLGFKEDRWIQMSEILPSSHDHVHHAVVYIRPPDSKWLRDAPLNHAFTSHEQHDAHWTDSDLLLVYAPGSSPDQWPEGMAKFVPAGSDLVFQMHYTTNGHAAVDQTSVGLVFAKQAPERRVITLQLTNDRFEIPPGDPDYEVEVSGTLPNDALLLGFFPHMHLRGKRFEYNIVRPGGNIETLLRVNYDFHWQLSYRLAKPRPLKAGTRLQAVAWFDNSAQNPHNPDPTATVRWGDQTYEEMMVGFFDIAVPRDVDKQKFFIRPM